MAGCAKTIQINLGVIEVAQLPGSCAKIRSATKTLILFLYSDSRVEENRQLGKLHLTVWFPVIDPLLRERKTGLFSLISGGKSLIHWKAFKHIFTFFTVRDKNVGHPIHPSFALSPGFLAQLQLPPDLLL